MFNMITEQDLYDALLKKRVPIHRLEKLEIIKVQSPDGASLSLVFGLLREQNLIKHITELKLLNNGLDTLPEGLFEGMENLTLIDLSRNRLKTLPKGLFGDTVNLWMINIEENQLTNLPEGLFTGLGRLRVLDLSRNQLIDLPEHLFQDLEKLGELELDANHLRVLPEGLFKNLSALEWLGLANNQLSALPENLFQGLGKLKRLLLRNNQLTTLPDDLFQGLVALRERHCRLGNNFQLQKNGQLNPLTHERAPFKRPSSTDIYDYLCACYKANHPDTLTLIDLSLQAKCAWAYNFNESQRKNLYELYAQREEQFQSLETTFEAPHDVTALIFSFAYNTNPGDAFRLSATYRHPDIDEAKEIRRECRLTKRTMV